MIRWGKNPTIHDRRTSDGFNLPVNSVKGICKYKLEAGQVGREQVPCREGVIKCGRIRHGAQSKAAHVTRFAGGPTTELQKLSK